MNSAHSNAMSSLSATLMHTLSGVVRPESHVVYFDYPVHLNVGDMLINMGVEEFFKKNRNVVRGRYSLWEVLHVDASSNYAFKRTICAADLHIMNGCQVILHGGGNFGDLYPQFDMFRRMIVNRYPNASIVILPQSIYYNDIEEERRAFQVIASHSRLSVCCRDIESFEIATRYGVEAVLAPDLAHLLWGNKQFRSSDKGNGTLILRRNDKESLCYSSPSKNFFDWDDIQSPANYFAYRVISSCMRRYDCHRDMQLYRVWYILRNMYVRKSSRVLSRYQKISTDRLHGMLFALLLNRDVEMLDNSYGKLSRYRSAWLHGINCTAL